MARVSAGFRFRKSDQVGASGAEEDGAFLRACFVDTGDLDLLCRPSDHRVIVLGRTGTGKSALLAQLLDREESALRIAPESLALNYISNSTILQFFAGIGVNLDPFFKLLWRHVIAVELLAQHCGSSKEEKPKSLLALLRAKFSGPSKAEKRMQEAIGYLEEWGQSFWQETDYRVKEIARKFESDLRAEAKAALGVKDAGLETRISGRDLLSEEEKATLKKRGQDIVSRAQIKDLERLMELVDKVLDNPQKPYFVVIDDLDKGWAEDGLRYKLVMALIESVREFIRVRHAKVIIAMRRDLVDRVFRLTRGSGFQEEKYTSLCLPLTWTEEQLLELLDRRINHLVARAYTTQGVTHKDLLPKEYKGLAISDFIASAATRPRDVIALFNACILAAVNEPRLSVAQLKNAEGEYSRGRLRALADEWNDDYPSLIEYARILGGLPSSLQVGDIPEGIVGEVCLDIAIREPGSTGLLRALGREVAEGRMRPCEFIGELVRVFYVVGMVGLKLAPHDRESWADATGRSVSRAEITETTTVVVHPAYRRSLGVVDKASNKRLQAGRASRGR